MRIDLSNPINSADSLKICHTTDQTTSNQIATISTAQAARVTSGQVALYTFVEGSGATVHDVSGVAPALDLTVQDLAAVAWIDGGGLAISASTLIASDAAAAKIVAGARTSEALTVEAWVKPANTIQSGPARMVTVSQSGSARNFTLGQGESKYGMRLRTTTTGVNGVPTFYTADAVATTDLSHVVFTRQPDGAGKIYKDGVEVAGGSQRGRRWRRRHQSDGVFTRLEPHPGRSPRPGHPLRVRRVGANQEDLADSEPVETDD